jgi:hypothetical protein
MHPTSTIIHPGVPRSTGSHPGAPSSTDLVHYHHVRVPAACVVGEVDGRRRYVIDG